MVFYLSGRYLAGKTATVGVGTPTPALRLEGANEGDHWALAVLHHADVT